MKKTETKSDRFAASKYLRSVSRDTGDDKLTEIAEMLEEDMAMMEALVSYANRVTIDCKRYKTIVDKFANR